MNDPIAKKLDDEWTPHVIDEPSVEVVRAWLRLQDEANLRLYLSTFQETLDEHHRTRAALLREELTLRQAPSPDRVKEIVTVLRANWLFSGIAVFGMTVGILAVFKENWCKLAPFTPLLCADQIEERKLIDLFKEK